MRVFIDVNVPMYAAGGESSYKTPCQQVLRAVAVGEIEGVTDAEALQEILYRYSLIGKREQARKVFDAFRRALGAILPITEQDVLLARYLHEMYDIRPRDLVHAAVMLNAGITEICSADADFDRIEGIHRIDPRKYGIEG